ncbi:hypothetical protein Bca101_000511 [Brassica carinata]
MMKANEKPKPHAPIASSLLTWLLPPLHTVSSTSQSFTQWRFLHHLDQTPSTVTPPPPPPPLPITTILEETFQTTELHLTSVSESDKLLALQLLERVIVPDPPSDPTCPPGLMRGLVSCLRSNNIVTAKHVTKILLALCLAEGNRHVAVEAGPAQAVVETAAGLDITALERALAALELMCTTAEGAAEVRGHAMTVPAIKGVSGEEIAVAPAEEVARAVALALEGVYSERKKKKPPIEDP